MKIEVYEIEILKACLYGVFLLMNLSVFVDISQVINEDLNIYYELVRRFVLLKNILLFFPGITDLKGISH